MIKFSIFYLFLAMENDFVLDRSSEITEIDTRLKRLQQYMKDHMP